MKKAIRVLSVIDGLAFGGTESRLLIMGRTLDRSVFHHSVLTLCPSAYSTTEDYLARRGQFRDAGIQVDDLAGVRPTARIDLPHLLGKAWEKTGILRRARALARIAKAWNVDVIDGYLNAAGLVSALAGRMANVPTSVTLFCGNLEGDAMIWPRAVRLSVQLASAVMTDSRYRARELQALAGSQREKVFVVPTGVPRPCSSQTRDEMRARLGLPRDPTVRVIGQVARLIDYKGQAVLLRAARQVLDQSPQTAFLLAGTASSESFRESLVQLAAELGIAKRVVITECRDNIGDIWNAIDIHTHPSLFDSLPVAIAEGMSLAKPAVVTTVGGIPEMVVDGKTGLVVPPGHVDELANALLRLLQRPALASALGEGAQRRYEELYLPELMTQSMQDYFLRLATQS